MRFFRSFITSLVLLLAITNTLFGAEFFSKQTGTTTIAAGTASSTVTISSVDMSKSFLVFSSTLDANQPQFYQIGGEITNATTLTFARVGTTGTVSISWQVFQFESGVSVQHGSTLNVARGAPVNVAINCIDLTKSFVIISARKSGSTFGADDGITANLTTSTNMELMISNAGPGGADMEEAYWQVIEYEAATVKKITTTLAAGSATTTSTISPAITTLSKAFVVSNHWFDGNANSDDLPRTEITNATTVTYTRVGTTTSMNFVTYVIEFTDQSTVTRGIQNFTSGTTLQDIAVTAPSSSGVIAPGNFGRQGSTSFATDDNTGHGWFTYEITSPTNLQITRAVGTGSTADAPWQIVTFEDTDNGLQTSTFYSIGSGAWETSANWSYTPDGSSGAVPTGVYPRRTNNVVIQSGHSITVNSVTDNNPCSQSPNGLGLGNVGAFTGSGDQMFYHTGDILIANGGTLTSSEEVLIGGYTLIENGGTFTINEDIVNLGYLEVSSVATFSNTDDLILSGNSTTIINNTSSSLDDIYIDHTDALLCGSGAFNIGGDPDPTVQYLNGATSAQICSSFPITCTDTTPPCVPFTPPSGNFLVGNIGPGGVGDQSNNVLWLRANSGTSTATNGSPVSSWNDQSGNSNDAAQLSGTQQPLFQSSVINGQPTLLFDNVGGGTNDELVVPDNDNLDNTNGLSILSVVRPLNLNGAARAIVSKRVGFNSSQSYSSFFLTGNRLNIDIDQGNNRFSSIAAFVNSTNYISSILYDGTLAAASRVRLYINGGLDVTATEASATIPNYASDLTIGSLNVGDGRPFGGHIAEVIIYRTALNEAQRIITNNYLSAKYDITISANDVYTMDDVGNGDYDFEVAGIGQAADGSNHRDAKGSGIVRMWNPNGLANGEFLLWGHDNIAITSSTTAGVGAPIEERLSRIWRVSETGDVGNVSISFDFNSIGGSPLGSNLRLLIDRDGDGFADNDVTPIVGTVSGGIAVFSSVNFQDGDRFTLGNTDASTPLPIELTSLEATPFGSFILVQWTTASELDNDFFTVEKSANAEEWDEVINIAGAGTSTVGRQYQIQDDRPLSGISYYRLKQTDFDGQFEYSHIVSVNYEGTGILQVSPNPSTGRYTLTGVNQVPIQIRIYNSLGQPIQAGIIYAGNDTILDITSSPAGFYVLQVSDGASLRSIRVIKR